MQIEFNVRSGHRHILSVMLMLFVFCMSCKEDNSETEQNSPDFDPSKPVLISDFTPKEGGAYQKMVIYGENGYSLYASGYGLYSQPPSGFQYPTNY